MSTVFGPAEPTERDMIRAVNAAPVVEAMAGFDAAVPYYEAAAATMQAYMAPARAELEADIGATAPIADRAAGVLQGAVDAVQGTAHEARSGDREHWDTGREAAAHARWAAGLPPRNQWERDHFAKLEVEVTAGRMHLDRVAKQASAVEAAREAEAAAVEAGS